MLLSYPFIRPCVLNLIQNQMLKLTFLKNWYAPSFLITKISQFTRFLPLTWFTGKFLHLLRATLLTLAAKSLQSCPTLCDPIDGSPTGSPIPGILQARTLEWVAISFSNAWKWKVKVKSLSRVWLLATPWTAAHQAPPFFPFHFL